MVPFMCGMHARPFIFPRSKQAFGDRHASMTIVSGVTERPDDSRYAYDDAATRP